MTRWTEEQRDRALDGATPQVIRTETRTFDYREVLEASTGTRHERVVAYAKGGTVFVGHFHTTREVGSGGEREPAGPKRSVLHVLMVELVVGLRDAQLALEQSLEEEPRRW